MVESNVKIFAHDTKLDQYFKRMNILAIWSDMANEL